MALLPTTQQVGRLMYWRTRAQLDKSVPATTLIGDFTDDTEPTGVQAQQIIDLAGDSLVDVTGALAAAEAAYPDEIDSAIRAAIAYQAAADIEASFPNTDEHRLAWLQSRADALKIDVRAAVGEFLDTGETGLGGSSGAYYADPACWPVYTPPEGSPFVLGNRLYPTGFCDTRAGIVF